MFKNLYNRLCCCKRNSNRIRLVSIDELYDEINKLQEENIEKENRINYLSKKYLKLQPRVQYQESNVIYILTTEHLKKEGRYILGKAKNLTNRLSTYNKTDEHEVIYYQTCIDSDIMDIVEKIVFEKLKNYREQANRERFILPKKESIDIFIECIKDTINFISK
jgi:hypothetical protein